MKFEGMKLPRAGAQKQAGQDNLKRLVMAENVIQEPIPEEEREELLAKENRKPKDKRKDVPEYREVSVPVAELKIRCHRWDIKDPASGQEYTRGQIDYTKPGAVMISTYDPETGQRIGMVSISEHTQYAWQRQGYGNQNISGFRGSQGIIGHAFAWPRITQAGTPSKAMIFWQAFADQLPWEVEPPESPPQQASTEQMSPNVEDPTQMLEEY